ncbi:MAG: DNA recombination/repair protein RecA, partial [Candidatus Omnitrophota bacterium]
EKIGVMFGSPETTPGGRALKFYSSVRIDLRRIATLRSQDQIIGSRVKAKIIKNKVAPPFREAEFEIIYSEGVSRIGSLIDVAIDIGIIKKAGSWFSFQDKNIAQGREQLRSILKDDSALKDKLEEEVKNIVYQGGKNEE